MSAPASLQANPRRPLERAIHNVVRLPGRTYASMLRLFDPSYSLERQARSVRKWFTRDQLARLERIPGMCSHRECRLLAYLIGQAPLGGAIVEIGAWKGRVTAWLVEAAERRADRPRIFSIDPHGHGSWDDFCKTVEEFELEKRGVQIHRVSSRALGPTWSRPISFLWIDGAHDYESVSQDLAEFTPHVAVGGWIAMDDSAGGAFPGVERAIEEWLLVATNYVRVATVRNVSVFRRAS